MITPPIVGRILRAADQIGRTQVDLGPLAYVVTDDEWMALVAYIHQSQFTKLAKLTYDIKSMTFAGLRVVRESAL